MTDDLDPSRGIVYAVLVCLLLWAVVLACLA